MKRAAFKSFSAIIILILIVSNFLLNNFLPQENYCYTNYDETFIAQENFGGKEAYETILFKYGRFLKRHPDKEKNDPNLYRRFQFKVFKFWQWKDYLFSSARFDLPYRAK